MGTFKHVYINPYSTIFTHIVYHWTSTVIPVNLKNVVSIEYNQSTACWRPISKPDFQFKDQKFGILNHIS